jgi:hypothetical protein
MISKTLQHIFISAIAIFSITFMSSCGESVTNYLENGLIGIWSADEDPEHLFVFKEDKTFIEIDTESKDWIEGRWDISDTNKLILEAVDSQIEKMIYDFEIDADRLLIRDPQGKDRFLLTRFSNKDLSEIPSEISKVIFDESESSLPTTDSSGEANVSGNYRHEANPDWEMDLLKNGKGYINSNVTDSFDYTFEKNTVYVSHMVGAAKGTIDGKTITFPQSNDIVGMSFAGKWVKN